ncbi:isopeptide-forming domain-containing fimbrial protein [Paenibacillus sp. J2TS4]|uniref:isopeptide-forming domain-containing fimbrial protein n=1 Tax=Paenibacillus sp. J2TS4 TaxID=2807194 RepID=UPI001B1646CD|nr:isopeptide-forming domain-containing fimbrial protein [Paenibacillus sp. J2TS4]GIP35800.1 hypothetical protein J2TS4_50100 [Paenibacillus sp. J2TS4]
MSSTRLTGTTKYKLKQFLVKFCVFLLVIGGVLPFVSPAQIHAAEPLSINDTDSYGIAWLRPNGYIYQYSGSDTSPTPVASVQITGVPSGGHISNGLAVSMTQNVFYAYGVGADEQYMLYKINLDGTAQPVATLPPLLDNGVISQDDTKYYYMYTDDEGTHHLGSYDLTTGQQTSVEIKGVKTDRAADLVIDSHGYVWFTSLTADFIYQMDPDTGEVLRSVPVTSSDGKNVSDYVGVRGLSFLPNGNMLISSGSSTTGPTYFVLNPSTLQTTFIGSGTGPLVYDLASRVTPNFDPNPPELESKKEAEIQEKAEGNTDAEHPEVGDTLLYTIQTRNTIENSLVKNLVISDTIPEGLEYVSGTLTVDGTVVSDDQDDDQGEFAGSKVTGRFGDVTDTEWHILSFQVKVTSGQAGQSIENIAAVTGDNLDKPDEPNHTVDVYPLDPTNPPNACSAAVALINGSFEDGAERGSYDPTGLYFYESEVPGWLTTDDAMGVKLIEIWNYKLGLPGAVTNFAPPVDGDRWAELNAYENGMLYQDIETTPGQTIYWRLSHMGRQGVDTMQVRIGPATNDPYDTVAQTQMSTGNTAWETYTGSYTVPAGQTTTRFGFEALSTASGSIGAGNFLDDIFLGTEPCVTAEKSVSAEGDVFEGDELTYEVTVKNAGGDIAANTVIEDAIPEGAEYVPGSMKILNGPKRGDLTDEDDEDAGHYADGKVTFTVGDLPNTNDLPEGITVQFKVKALSSQVGKPVTNKAQVTYKNLLKDADGEVWSNEVTNNVVERPDPPNACTAPVALINGSFEEPPFSPNDSRLKKQRGWFDAPQDAVPGWKTTDRSGLFEIMNKSLGDEIPPGDPYENLKVTPAHGQQFAELNSREAAQLYQDVETTPGQTIYWRLAHKGRTGQDTMALKIDSATVDPKDLKTIETMTSGKDAWEYYSGSYVVPAGQTKTRFGFEAVSSASGGNAAGNFLDDIFLGTEPCVVAEKTVSPEGEVYAGQELTYEVTIKNNGGDIAANAVFEDAIPAGTEYVPGSLKITNGSGQGDLTDEDDSDAGHFDGQKVIVNLGDLPNANNLPDGITVQFKVKALVNDSTNEIVNKAQVGYDNLLTNEKEQIESNETKTSLTYQKPVLESKKTATIEEKADGNTDGEHPEVGDTLLYTISTKNTISDSLVKNLIIADVIPEGLEYVEDSLKMDGVEVTDAEDDDNGHYKDGTVIGQFGDITDTDEHTITFLVTVGEGQAGKDIKNIAIVGGENMEEPDEPEEELIVYPRDPVLESKKSAKNLEEGKAKFEVGDTVVYTIETRNTVTESLVANLTISDTIPDGLEYVSGSLTIDGEPATDAEGDDNGHYKDGTVVGQLGNVEDANWHTLVFHAKILSGQSGKTIQNVATVNGEDIEEPDEPEETVKVDPKYPKLESTKSSKLEEKAAGNNDADHPEVGDTIRYTITTRNTIEDSLVENLVITDAIPEGLTYVPDSLEVDGQKVTDTDDNDAGHVVGGTVTGTFGHVTDTNDHTVTFLVTVDTGQAGADIKNIAVVGGDNTEVPDEPEEEVLVYPRDPKFESEKTAANLDQAKEKYEVGDTVVYTIRARNTVSESIINNFTISDKLMEGLEYVEGSLKADPEVDATFENGTVTANFGEVKDTEWRTLTFHAKIQSGQSGKELKNIATVEGEGVPPTHPEVPITVDPKDPKLESKKSSKLEEKAEGNQDADHPEVGDTIRYTITTRNTIEDSLVENLIITDAIPEGLTYVPGSLEVDGQKVTDAEDDDSGHVVDGKVTGTFGNVTDTEEHTVTFLVTVDQGQAGADIQNIAVVGGDNTEDPDEPSTSIEVFPRDSTLESVKTAVNQEAGKSVFEVGDTVIYTIKARNTVSDSLIRNFVISDVLPEGLAYVPGSLKVDGVSVTDSVYANGATVTGSVYANQATVTGSVYGEDGAVYDDNGYVADGRIVGMYGDITDTNWHTLEFKAMILDGQEGGKIVNVAEVTGDDMDKPGRPTVEIDVENKPPTEPDNRPPTAPDYRVTTPKDTPLSGKIEGEDPDGDELTYEKGKDPKHGTVVVDEDGNWTYTPDPGFVGEDSFTVIVDDGKGGKTEVTITVEVTESDTLPVDPDNRPPTAPDYKVTTPKNTPVSGKIEGEDPDGDPLTYTKGKDPKHGKVTVNPDGTWTYTPDPGFVGKDSFTVIVDDGKGGKKEVTVTVEVTEPTPPTDDDDESPSPGPGGGIPPISPGNGTPPTDSDEETPSTDPGQLPPPIRPVGGTPPTKPEEGTPPSESEDVESSEEPGKVMPPAETEEPASPSDSEDVASPEVPANDSPADSTDTQQLNRLPNTSTNLYNLGLLGAVLLLAGLLLMRRKSNKMQ